MTQENKALRPFMMKAYENMKTNKQARIDAVLDGLNPYQDKSEKDILNLIRKELEDPVNIPGDFLRKCYQETLASLGGVEPLKETDPHVNTIIEQMNQPHVKEIILHTQSQLGTKQAAVEKIFAQLYTKNNTDFSNLPSHIQTQALVQMEIEGLLGLN